MKELSSVPFCNLTSLISDMLQRALASHWLLQLIASSCSVFPKEEGPPALGIYPHFFIIIFILFPIPFLSIMCVPFLFAYVF